MNHFIYSCDLGHRATQALKTPPLLTGDAELLLLDEVTNRHCEVGEVVGFMSELTQLIHTTRVARGSRF